MGSIPGEDTLKTVVEGRHTFAMGQKLRWESSGRG